MRQAATDPHREDRDKPILLGQQLTMDALHAPTNSLAGNKYCDLITDLTNHWIHPVFTRNRTAEELVRAVSGFFNKHPELLRAGSLERFIRCDPEPSCRSTEFVACLSSFGYAVEGTPPRWRYRRALHRTHHIEGKRLAVLSKTQESPGSSMGPRYPVRMHNACLQLLWSSWRQPLPLHYRAPRRYQTPTSLLVQMLGTHPT
jgi:hypothetical protein